MLSRWSCGLKIDCLLFPWGLVVSSWPLWKNNAWQLLFKPATWHNAVPVRSRSPKLHFHVTIMYMFLPASSLLGRTCLISTCAYLRHPLTSKATFSFPLLKNEITWVECQILVNWLLPPSGWPHNYISNVNGLLGTEYLDASHPVWWSPIWWDRKSIPRDFGANSSTFGVETISQPDSHKANFKICTRKRALGARDVLCTLKFIGLTSI